MPGPTKIAEALLADLSDATPQVLVVKGPWGCGKTHLWANEVAPKLAKPNAVVVTTSLFGTSTVEELRNRLATGAMFAAPKALATWEARLAALRDVGVGALKQAGKAAGQAIDTWAGTSAFASRIDYLELVPEGAVFCIDDVERAGPDVDIRGILGVVNYLVEARKCSVVLIMDDEKLGEKEEDFQKFKERVVRGIYALEPDLPTAFDRLAAIHLSGLDGPGEGGAVRSIILGVFERTSNSNLRTLDRVLRFISRLRALAAKPLPGEAIAFAGAMILEDSLGQLGPRGQYEFSTVQLLFQDKESGMTAQREFLRRYYADMSSFQFVAAIYDSVMTGIMDGTRIADELFPDKTPSSEAGRLVALTQNESFGFLDDKGYEAFFGQVAARMADSTNPLTAAQSVHLFGCAAFAAERAGLTWSGEIEEQARTHVRRAAGGPDESLRQGFDVHMFMGMAPYTRDLLDVYTLTARGREARERESRLIVAIDRCDVGSLGRVIGMDWELLRLLTTDASLLRRALSSPDTRFRHYAIEMIVDKLAEFSDTQFPWVPAAKTNVHAALTDLRANAPDNSERSRLDRRLRVTGAWAAVKTESGVPTGEPGAHEANADVGPDAEQ